MNKPGNNAESLFELFQGIVDGAMKDQLSKNKKAKDSQEYTTIEEYKLATGLRFRRSKDQMKRGLSRDESFQEFLNEERKE